MDFCLMTKELYSNPKQGSDTLILDKSSQVLYFDLIEKHQFTYK